MSAIRAADFALESNLLSFPESVITPDDPMPNWNIYLGDRFHQQAEWALVEDGIPGFILRSNNQHSEIRLTSQVVHVSAGMHLSMNARIKKSSDFSGNVAIVMILVQNMEALSNRGSSAFKTVSFETNQHFAVKEPTMYRKDGWCLAKQTKNLPARSHSVIFQIRGKFQGTVFIRDIHLERKK